VPSIIRLTPFATVPSNANFSGALATYILRPDRSPDSAARKSLMPMLPSTR
jgi:hypothetical protein